MQLKISTRKLNDGIIVVDCAGRIIFGDETAALRDRVREIISAEQPHRPESRRRHLHR